MAQINPANQDKVRELSPYDFARLLIAIFGDSTTEGIKLLGKKSDATFENIKTDDSGKLLVYDSVGAIDLAAILSRIGDPTGHTLASLTAKWGDLARSLDLILGSRWDASGDLGTDIASILASVGSSTVNQGLCYYGTVTAVPGANQFTIAALADMGNAKFADATAPYRAFVMRDAGGAGAAPQGEMQSITAYVSATGTFTTEAFSEAVAVGDEILIIHPRLADIGQRSDAATADDLSDITTTSIHAKVRRILLRMSSDAFTATIQGAARTELDTMLYQLATYISALGAAYSATVNPGGAAKTNIEQTLEDIGDMLAGATGIVTFPAASPAANGVSVAEVIRYIQEVVDAISTLSETGGTLLADGTEQNVVIVDAPASVFYPRKVMIDLTNMAGVDNTVVKSYYRIKAGGAYVLKDSVTYTGPQDPDLINVELEPNRHGFKVTLQQTAGVMRNYDWEYFYEG